MPLALNTKGMQLRDVHPENYANGDSNSLVALSPPWAWLSLLG